MGIDGGAKVLAAAALACACSGAWVVACAQEASAQAVQAGDPAPRDARSVVQAPCVQFCPEGGSGQATGLVVEPMEATGSGGPVEGRAEGDAEGEAARAPGGQAERLPGRSPGKVPALLGMALGMAPSEAMEALAAFPAAYAPSESDASVAPWAALRCPRPAPGAVPGFVCEMSIGVDASRLREAMGFDPGLGGGFREGARGRTVASLEVAYEPSANAEGYAMASAKLCALDASPEIARAAKEAVFEMSGYFGGFQPPGEQEVPPGSSGCEALDFTAKRAKAPRWSVSRMDYKETSGGWPVSGFVELDEEGASGMPVPVGWGWSLGRAPGK